MTIFKNVYFIDGKEFERVKKERADSLTQYLGYIHTCCCGRGLIVKPANDSIPTWILSAILTYLEKSCLGKTIIHQDYAFFIHLFDDKCFIEVDTSCVIRG